ncbi:hypothetical protein JZ751_022807 [Albula glossodonta]|uniref:Secreted protein n=1 Tax=Albula glossodonta TaxID=121402 RepID=A0A8T2PIK1_9TELE|nr:hypothetical protein JZ751_022807 [Albula glossodonta]
MGSHPLSLFLDFIVPGISLLCSICPSPYCHPCCAKAAGPAGEIGSPASGPDLMACGLCCCWESGCWREMGGGDRWSLAKPSEVEHNLRNTDSLFLLSKTEECSIQREEFQKLN